LEEFNSFLAQVCEERGIDFTTLDKDEIKLFCTNAQSLEVTSFRSIAEELDHPDYSDFVNEFYDEESVAPWYVC